MFKKVFLKTAFSSSSKKLFSTKVTVIGGGKMGTGIGYVFSRHALANVTIYDYQQESLDSSSELVSNCFYNIRKIFK